jgi:hypothetical protein
VAHRVVHWSSDCKSAIVDSTSTGTSLRRCS